MRKMAKHRAPVVIDAATRELLASLLAIETARAVAVRDETPSRRRPLRQQGPSASYGDPGDNRRGGPIPGA